MGKFDEAAGEIISHMPNFVCITETWLNIYQNMKMYQLIGYNSFNSSKRTTVGSGAMLFIDSQLSASQLSHDIIINDAHNMCAVTIRSARDNSLVIVAYRAP